MKIIALAVFVIFITQPLLADDIYTYTDKNGVIVITNTPIPGKYEKNAKKIESYKRDSPEEIQKFQTQQKMYEQKQEAESHHKQHVIRAQSGNKTSESAYEIKRKELSDNFNRAYKKYHEEEQQRLQHHDKKPSSEEKKARDEMFKAQEEEHSFVFSPENIKEGRVIEETITTTTTRGKSK